MAILSDFLGSMNRANPAVGSGSSSIGTTVFVMNTDAKTANTDWDDPYLNVYGSGNNNDNIRPIVVPSMGLHLEINVVWREADGGSNENIAADTPVVAIYGEVPAPQPSERYWPVDVESTLCGTSDSAANHTDSFWIPLCDWDNVEVQIADHQKVDHHNLIALCPDGVIALDSGDGTPGIRMGVPRRVYLSGCTRIICTIETACANAQHAMVIGRFVG